MSSKPVRYSAASIEGLIVTIRGQRVILDRDLAAIYGLPTKRLNEQVKRNAGRFPADFAFQLTPHELMTLRSQFATSNGPYIRPQFATGSRGGLRYLPYAFTEHGAIMAANVMNSPQAVAMSVFVVRAFVQMREHLIANAAILKRLAEIDKTLLEHDQVLSVLWQRLKPLLEPPPEPPKRQIGYRKENSQ